MYTKILLGYDGTSFGDAALEEAIALAKASGGEITVVTVVEREYQMEAMAPELDDKYREKAAADLGRAEQKIKAAGIACRTEKIVTELPYKAIVEIAGREKSELIVLGTHGRTGLMRLLMGSTAERVIGHAPCNVLIVRADNGRE